MAHGSVIHTDELTALFGLAGLLALGLVLGVPTVPTATSTAGPLRSWPASCSSAHH